MSQEIDELKKQLEEKGEIACMLQQENDQLRQDLQSCKVRENVSTQCNSQFLIINEVIVKSEWSNRAIISFIQNF
jgi:regulator of replication initiation timing